MSRARGRKESGSSLENLSFDDDEYNRQDVSSVLPPSARSRRSGSTVSEGVDARSRGRSPQHTHTSPAKPSPRASASKRQDQRLWYYGEPPSTTDVPPPLVTHHEGPRSGAPLSGREVREEAVTMPAYDPPTPRAPLPDTTGEPIQRSAEIPPPRQEDNAEGEEHVRARNEAAAARQEDPIENPFASEEEPREVPVPSPLNAWTSHGEGPAVKATGGTAAREQQIGDHHNPFLDTSAWGSGAPVADGWSTGAPAPFVLEPFPAQDGAPAGSWPSEEPAAAEENGVVKGEDEPREREEPSRISPPAEDVEGGNAHLEAVEGLAEGTRINESSSSRSASASSGAVVAEVSPVYNEAAVPQTAVDATVQESVDGDNTEEPVNESDASLSAATASAVQPQQGEGISRVTETPIVEEPAEDLDDIRDPADREASSDYAAAVASQDGANPVFGSEPEPVEHVVPLETSSTGLGTAPPVRNEVQEAQRGLVDGEEREGEEQPPNPREDVSVGPGTLPGAEEAAPVHAAAAPSPAPVTETPPSAGHENPRFTLEEPEQAHTAPVLQGTREESQDTPGNAPFQWQQQQQTSEEALDSVEVGHSTPPHRELVHPEDNEGGTSQQDGATPFAMLSNPHSAPLTPEHQYPRPTFDSVESSSTGRADPQDGEYDQRTRNNPNGEEGNEGDATDTAGVPTEAPPRSHRLGKGKTEDQHDSVTATENLPVTQPAVYDGNRNGEDIAADATELDDFTMAGGDSSSARRRSTFDSASKGPSTPQPEDKGSHPLSVGPAAEDDEAHPSQRVPRAPTPSGSSSLFNHSVPDSRTSQLYSQADSFTSPADSATDRDDLPSHTRVFLGRRDDHRGGEEGLASSQVVDPLPMPSAPEDTGTYDHTTDAGEMPWHGADQDPKYHSDSFSPRSLQATTAPAAAAVEDAPQVHFAEHLNTVVPPPPAAPSTSAGSSPSTAALPTDTTAAATRPGQVYDERDELETEVVVVRPLTHPRTDGSPVRSTGSGSPPQDPDATPANEEGAGVVSVDREVPQKMTADEMQEARLKAYDEDCTVSTLDFLRETGDTVLPDAVANMFAATSNFLQSGKDAIAQSVPEPLRNAARKTGRGVALFAGFTGDLIANAPEYVLTAIPNSLVSQETKQLVAVDFLAVMRVTIDVNILAAPYIFRMAGLLGGLLILIGMHLLCYYNTAAFFAAKNQLREATSVVMYGDVPRMTWGKWFPMISLWYGAAFLVAYISYAASNLKVLLGTMGITGGQATALSLIIPSVFSLPFVFMKRASTQKPLASIASLLVFISVVMFMTVFPYKSANEIREMKLRLWASDAAEFFVALGIAVYVFSPLRTAVPVERGMAPQRFIVLLRIAMSIAFCCHLVFGVCAFTALRADTCSVLAVSLPNGSVETAAAALLFFAFLCIIPLAQFRIGELCDRRVLGVRTVPTYWQLGPNLMRIVFLAGAIVVAYVLPYYGLLLGLGGAFGCGIIGVVVPAALDYVRRERVRLRHGRHLLWWEYVVVFANLMFGAVGVVLLGVLFAVYQLWAVIQGGYKVAC